jgi:hypothetical protein
MQHSRKNLEAKTGQGTAQKLPSWANLGVSRNYEAESRFEVQHHLVVMRDLPGMLLQKKGPPVYDMESFWGRLHNAPLLTPTHYIDKLRQES